MADRGELFGHRPEGRKDGQSGLQGVTTRSVKNRTLRVLFSRRLPLEVVLKEGFETRRRRILRSTTILAQTTICERQTVGRATKGCLGSIEPAFQRTAPMRTRADRKNEWLRYSNLNYSADDRWLRDTVASLFDLKALTEDQQRLLHMADLHLTLNDLPARAKPGHKEEMMSFARSLFPGTIDPSPR